MKKNTGKFYSFVKIFLGILFLLLSGSLLISAFVKTAYCTDMGSQVVLYKNDAVLFEAVGVLVVLICLRFLIPLFSAKGKNAERTGLLAVFGITGIIGGLLIAFGRTMPAADAMSVYSIAESFANGDLAAIHPTDSYLSYYPQQIGLATFYIPLIRLWKLLPTSAAAYHGIKAVYVLLVWCIIYFQFKTVKLLWPDGQTCFFYLLLATANLPLIFYSSFVYGEIPSFAAVSAAMYFLLFFLGKAEKKDYNISTWLSFSASLLLLAFGVLLRKNTLVLVIAVVLIVFMQWIRSPKSPILLFYIALCVLLSVNVLPTVQKIYEQKAGNTLKTGVTATSYVAMGMQEASRGNGWYNGFNFYTYQDTGMDTEETNRIAKEAISNRLTYFKEHKDYAVEFYLYKYLSQWTDGTYACRQATLANAGGRKQFLTDLYEGKTSPFFVGWCNFYQNILYLGTFLFCLLQLLADKKQKSHPFGIALYLGLVGALGGFLFHMLWEANSRYIFLYSLLLMPYCAAGIRECIMQKKSR